MPANRINRFEALNRGPAVAAPPVMIASPQAAGPLAIPPGFVVCPPGFVVCPPMFAMANGWQQQIYQLAYARAKAAAEMPRHHRLLCVWN